MLDPEPPSLAVWNTMFPPAPVPLPAPALRVREPPAILLVVPAVVLPACIVTPVPTTLCADAVVNSAV